MGPVRPTTDLERSTAPFRVISDFQPSGDQPAAIDELERRVRAGEQDVVLLGATGTGKSATTAWLIERLQRPTLVMAPNKTLAAQLANEFRELLPTNAVEYFVSYYDYYQPEAYVPQTDTYIEKDSSVNDEVERLQHSSTNSLLTRRDVIVVASVSCIYGLGTPQESPARAGRHRRLGRDFQPLLLDRPLDRGRRNDPDPGPAVLRRRRRGHLDGRRGRGLRPARHRLTGRRAFGRDLSTDQDINVAKTIRLSW